MPIKFDGRSGSGPGPEGPTPIKFDGASGPGPGPVHTRLRSLDKMIFPIYWMDDVGWDQVCQTRWDLGRLSSARPGLVLDSFPDFFQDVQTSGNISDTAI